MKRLLYLFLLCAAALHAQTGDTTCQYATQLPILMPDGFSGNLVIQIDGASNSTLGQNGQGVCSVEVAFEHEYLGDLRMVLTAPSGQSVTLIGPVGFFGGTDFTTWNVTFLPCGAPVEPDPPFSATWNNYQDWGINNTYSGSYYPSAGCLQDLTGPVDGNWTLTIMDAQAIDQGTLYGFSINFCDDTGINCGDCAANAGALTDPNMTVCVGSPGADLDLVPSYANQGVVPPAGEYDYTYLISLTFGDVLLAYDPDADLSALAPGSYTVCGLSYQTGADTLLPAPDGSLTTAQLRTQLNSGTPPFCGNITNNCVTVVVTPEMSDTTLVTSICLPDCIDFYGLTYCNSGTYIRNVSLNGCEFVATLVLTAENSPEILFTDTICAGACSTLPGFEDACTTGMYQRYVQTTQPGQCDTIVRLQLTVLNPGGDIEAPFTALTCAADTLLLTASPSDGIQVWTQVATGATFDGDSYVVTEPGWYTLVSTAAAGTLACVQTDSVQITSDPDGIEVYASGGTLSCGDTLVALTAQANGADLSYQWIGPNNFTSTEQNPFVSAPGTYHLTVSTDDGCSEMLTVMVTDTGALVVELSAGPLNCYFPMTTITALTNMPDPLFFWTGPQSLPNVQFPVITVPGVYTVIVVSASNPNCAFSGSVTVVGDFEAPVIETILASSPSGGQQNGSISIGVTGASAPYTYVWSLNGVIVSQTEDLVGLGPGFYSVTVTAANGCTAVQSYHLSSFTSGGYQVAVSTFSIRPNPGPRHNLVPFNGSMPAAQLRVYDSAGRLLWEQAAQEGSSEQLIDLGGMADGVYFLEVRGAEGSVWLRMVRG